MNGEHKWVIAASSSGTQVKCWIDSTKSNSSFRAWFLSSILITTLEHLERKTLSFLKTIPTIVGSFLEIYVDEKSDYLGKKMIFKMVKMVYVKQRVTKVLT